MKQTIRFTCPTGLPDLVVQAGIFGQACANGGTGVSVVVHKTEQIMLCVTLRIAQQSNMFGLLDAVMGYREIIFFSLRPHILRGIKLADRSILTV